MRYGFLQRSLFVDSVPAVVLEVGAGGPHGNAAGVPIFCARMDFGNLAQLTSFSRFFLLGTYPWSL